MKTVWVNYKLQGQIPIQISNVKSAYDQILDHLENGLITDEQLFSGIEQSDAFGIEFDAIEVTGIYDEENNLIWDPNEKE